MECDGLRHLEFGGQLRLSGGNPYHCAAPIFAIAILLGYPDLAALATMSAADASSKDIEAIR
jgi:hypothetical protein